MAIDRICYQPLREKNASNLIMAITSFGVFIFIQNLLQLIYGAQILTLRTGPATEGYQIFSAVITPTQILVLLISLTLSATTWLMINKTKIGNAIRAVGDDPLGASVSGIYTERIVLYAFGISSGLAGLAGILISFESNIDPTMGFNAILKGIIAAIVGGIGSFPGALLGGFFLGVVENVGIWKIQAEWKDTIAFAILLIFLLFRPQGILGKKLDKDRF